MRSTSGSSSPHGKPGRTPRRAPAESVREPLNLAIDEDIEDWLERSPRRGRAKARQTAKAGQAGARQDKKAGAVKRVSRRKPHASYVVNARKPETRNATEAERGVQHVRRPFWQRLRKVCLLLCGVLALEAGAALLSSPQCAISEVAVQGAHETPAVELDMICTSLIGQNFLRANKKDAIARTKKIPTVASASLAHDWLTWPPRLVLTVQERTPFARVGAGPDWWVVDEHGVPFRPARTEDDKLYAVTSLRLKPRSGVPLNTAAWKPVVQFAGILNRDAERAGGWNLRRVYFDKHGFASLRLTGGQSDETLVQLGAEGWPEKLQAARWALNDMAARGRHAQSINLISSSVATWTPRVPVETGAETDGTEEGTREEAASSSTPDSPSDTDGTAGMDPV